MLGSKQITYGGQEIDLASPWIRMTMIDAVAKYTGVDFTGVTDVEEARKMAAGINVPIESSFGVGKIINACFDEHVEDS